MKKITAAAACLALLPVFAAPAVAKGGLVGALASAARHAGGDDDDSGVTAIEGQVSAADPAGMAKAMQDLGYKAELTTDGVGDPLIKSSLEGLNYSIYFYGCVDNKGCDSIMYSAGFDLDDGMTPEKANKWNYDAVLATMYLDDENDPVLRHYVLTRGGIDPKVFEYSIKEWGQALSQFKDFIDW